MQEGDPDSAFPARFGAVSPRPLLPVASWKERLDQVVDMMREMSAQTDPQAMVHAYGARVRAMLPTDRTLSVSRRDLTAPNYRITRSSTWNDDINPWKEKARLPLLSGGLLAELIYNDEPAIIDDILPVLSDDDPARDYFDGMRSLMAIPNYDQGLALNMVIAMRSEPAAFEREGLPERVWMSNLFGRATHNLVLMDELKNAYAMVDRELRVVADIQRSLLPREVPSIPGANIATYYQTSRWAGGDYYDFFRLPDSRWGFLIADVSGHGTPAAVIMAITHSIAHAFPGPPTPPSQLLSHVNQQLTMHYTTETGTFVTALYAIYDSAKRTITYSCAGHNPPRLKRCGTSEIVSLDGVGGLPLGLFPGIAFDQTTIQLGPGDQLVFYTDGITEAHNERHEMYGLDRLDDQISRCSEPSEGLVESIVQSVEIFTNGLPPSDDRTLVVLRITS